MMTFALALICIAVGWFIVELFRPVPKKRGPMESYQGSRRGW